MEYNLVNAKDMASHEDYLTACLMQMISLEAMEKFHIRAVELGLLREDQECRANTIVWDLRRLKKILYDQAETILELLPDGFTVDQSLQKFAQSHVESLKKVTKTRKRV